jgi:hypothetical protein
MTDFLAESFKAVVGIGAWIAVLACLGFGLYGFAVLGWRPIAALAAATFGLFITVVSFGSLALMIKNNALLKKSPKVIGKRLQEEQVRRHLHGSNHG